MVSFHLTTSTWRGGHFEPFAMKQEVVVTQLHIVWSVPNFSGMIRVLSWRHLPEKYTLAPPQHVNHAPFHNSWTVCRRVLWEVSYPSAESSCFIGEGLPRPLHISLAPFHNSWTVCRRALWQVSWRSSEFRFHRAQPRPAGTPDTRGGARARSSLLAALMFYLNLTFHNRPMYVMKYHGLIYPVNFCIMHIKATIVLTYCMWLCLLSPTDPVPSPNGSHPVA